VKRQWSANEGVSWQYGITGRIMGVIASRAKAEREDLRGVDFYHEQPIVVWSLDWLTLTTVEKFFLYTMSF